MFYDFISSFMFKHLKLILPASIGGSLMMWYTFNRYFYRMLKPAPNPTTPEQDFIERRKKEFELFLKEEHGNSNIDLVLYDVESYKAMDINDVEALEAKWKTRLMCDSVSKCNIMMYYDLYKHAFAYASDQTVSYPLLNAAAMRYVQLYRCKDFFRDNQFLPDHKRSPFTDLDLEEEKREAEKEKEKKMKKGIAYDSSVFVKPRPIPKSTKTETENVQKEAPPPSIEFYANHFRNVGKLKDFEVLQPSPKVQETYIKVADTNKSYKDFKKAQQKDFCFHDVDPSAEQKNPLDYEQKDYYSRFFLDSCDMNVQRLSTDPRTSHSF